MAKLTKEDASNTIGRILLDIEPQLQKIFKAIAESESPKDVFFHYSAVVGKEVVGDAYFTLMS